MLAFFDRLLRKLRKGAVVGEGVGMYEVEYLDRSRLLVSAPNPDEARRHALAVGLDEVFSIRRVK